MDCPSNKQIEPICRFGPGGDFISVWPDELKEYPQPSTNHLAGLLNWLSEITTALLGSGFEPTTAGPENIQAAADRILCQKGKLEYAVENNKADKPAHSTPTTTIKSDSLFSGQPILFADNRRISLRTGCKPKHSIRAYRRTAKKSPAPGLPGQGSLFEADFKSAKTA